ncbi:SH3 domain-containing protein [Mesorhizobium sp. J18]|uniref:SH3 domain-containing protein n=1 Tax=Mesorhizobium sp. J18 TaxID=935263 RepID=UPI00119B3A62|nr:SH3 domain-containing protein [Mesorhizobium sp. J18]TWG98928.1 SH3 domain-containing protein [Mesorhizobium sp. J18]
MESQSPRRKGIDWTNPPAPYEPPPVPPRPQRSLLLTGIAGGIAVCLTFAAVLSFNGTVGNEMTDTGPVVVAEADTVPTGEEEPREQPATAGRLARATDNPDAAEPAPLATNDPRWGTDSPAPDAEEVAAVTAHAEASGMENAYAERQRPQPDSFDRRSTASVEEPDVAIAETEEEIQALEAIEGEAEAEASETVPEAEQQAVNPPDGQTTAAEQPAQELPAVEPQAEDTNNVTEEDARRQIVALPPAARPSGPLVPAVTTDGVNLRSGPTNSSSVVAVLVANLPVQASQNCPSWCEVVVNGRRGYVYKDFIRYGQDGAQATGAQAPPAAQPQQGQAAQTEPMQPAADQPPIADPLQRSRSLR